MFKSISKIKAFVASKLNVEKIFVTCCKIIVETIFPNIRAGMDFSRRLSLGEFNL